MKRILTIIFMQMSIVLIGQVDSDHVIGSKIRNGQMYNKTDTIPKVTYLKGPNENNEILWFLNEEKVGQQLVSSINPLQIKGIKVEKDTITTGSHEYYGKIYIETKEGYNPNFITLYELKEKYLEVSNDTPVLFILDGQTIVEEYDQFMIDEKYILNIEVQFIQNDKEGLDLYIIRLLTRNEKNLKKMNTIYLKGNGWNNIEH